MSKLFYQDLVVKNIIGVETITQVFVFIFECQKPVFLQNLAKNSALKRLIVAYPLPGFIYERYRYGSRSPEGMGFYDPPPTLSVLHTSILSSPTTGDNQ